ncbi:hypothetical protein NBRC111894_4207 [Sporolactobacillus inulinus]|uniref:Uncharacterized protein n=1 Tax=Sporolactobacillus inulinus TaxID=2078 RepID=A0A4Y1ZI50_9BACL|nr:hypothetical protein NBRC111894_4207 [Sporolactobacillus inulinus]
MRSAVQGTLDRAILLSECMKNCKRLNKEWSSRFRGVSSLKRLLFLCALHQACVSFST